MLCRYTALASSPVSLLRPSEICCTSEMCHRRAGRREQSRCGETLLLQILQVSQLLQPDASQTGGIHPAVVRAGSSQEQGVSGGSGVSALCSPTLRTAQWKRRDFPIAGEDGKKKCDCGRHSILLRFFT